MKLVVFVLFVGAVVGGCSAGQENQVKVETVLDVPKVESPVVEVTEPIEQKEVGKVVVDSAMTRAEALGDNDFPKNTLAQMEVIRVSYLGFDGLEHEGQLVVDRAVAEEVIEIFKEIRAADFPIVKMVPIVAYGWDDDASIADQNSSGFNYREAMGPGVKSGFLSKHSFGKAIDLNPYQSPFVGVDGSGLTPYAPGEKGVLTSDSAPVRIFKKYGWRWGGDWNGAKDYQHFDKR